jgi:TRAP-type C4-dicarboxylate transport system permease small subunit
VSFIQDKFKGKANNYAKILVHLICMAFFIIAVYYGIIYMKHNLKISVSKKTTVWRDCFLSKRHHKGAFPSFLTW